MKKLKFALVGCGRIGSRHAEHIVKIGELIAVCDIDSNKLEHFKSLYGCKTYDNIDQLFANEKELDVVSVCSPNALHASHSIRALNVNSWKGTKTLDGGTLYTQFSHFVDLLYWMVGDIKKVYALTANFAHQTDIEFEDTGVVAFEFFNGALGTINYTVNSHAQNMEGSLTIFAEKGTIKIGGQYLNELEYQNIKDFKFTDLPEGNKPNNYGNYQGSMSNHFEVYQNLVDVIQNGGTILTNVFEGLKTVEIIDKIYESASQLNSKK